MSIYPCDVHGSRVPGSLETAYPSILDGGVRWSRKLRLCVDHMDRFLNQYAGRWVDANSADEISPNEVCSSCGLEEALGGSTAAVFCTVYRRGQERKDYFGPICRRCAMVMTGALSLES